MNKLSNIMRSVAMLSLCAAGTFAILGADTVCVQGFTTTICKKWGTQTGSGVYSVVDHDAPQACTSQHYTKWTCVGGGYGYKITSNYYLGYTCTSGQDCY